jgi:DNA-binding IclR family transcriptional regulator
VLGTLTRAGAVLDLFTTEEPEWGVTAVAQRIGVGKSLAHDALASLASIGLLQRVGHGRYRLGWRTMTLASVLLRTSELKAQAHPVVRELAERRALPVSLTAWDCGRIVYLERCQAARAPKLAGPPAGSAAPIDDRAPAKVLLASRAADEVEALWGGGRVHTGHASVEELQAELACIRADGWARNDAGPEAASAAVAAPVRDAEGEVAGALSVELVDSLAGMNVYLHARLVVAAAARISAAMGGGRPAAARPEAPTTGRRTGPRRTEVATGLRAV